MLNKLILVAGFGAGYVLGAKAGTERYNQIQAKFNELAGKPAVQNATSTVKEKAADVADTAKATINDKVETLSDKADKAGKSAPDVVVVGLGTTPIVPPVSSTTTKPTAPKTAPTPAVTPKPMSGASASDSTTGIGTNRL